MSTQTNHQGSRHRRAPNRSRTARRAIERASSFAFESLEGRRLMKAPVEASALLPPMPALPDKQQVEAQTAA